jgi:molybdate transport system substrate-binding protein
MNRAPIVKLLFRACCLGAVMFGLALPLALPGIARGGETVRIAVASNFVSTLRVLSAHFERAYRYRVQVIPGSTGKLYAQIRNGAPFDVFLAADIRRPRLLEESGTAVPGTRFTYARGRLVLWSSRKGLVDDQGKVLREGRYQHLAMANPRLAPYGAAARAVLHNLGLWSRLRSRLVYGENIAQTFQFVAGGGAELGFVALSQLHRPHGDDPGSRWIVPTSLYPPIRQQAVLVHDTPAGRAFLSWLRSDTARALIREHGYTAPEKAR